MTHPKKLDLHKMNRAEYVKPRSPVLLTVKPARYLAVSGRGEPGDETFQAQLGALYSVAFTVKMARRFSGTDYTVCKLEGLWWGDNPKEIQLGQRRRTWNWQLMIRVPAFIEKDEVSEAIRDLLARSKPDEVADVNLLVLKEGACVQMLHRGPYDAEAPTLEKMHEFATAKGLKFRGLHHEIYLSDPRRVRPERLKTILRHPIQ